MKKAYGKKIALLAAASVSVLASGGAYAQSNPAATTSSAEQAGEDGGGVPEIVVTAERRTSSLQRTATSVSVREGDDLRDEGKYLLRDILEDVPGINGGQLDAAATIQGGGTDTAGAGIVIRGIRSNLGSGGSITSTASSVALYADDVYEGIGGTYDIERVEILRGPQGTLYGRSATGGVVAVHTSDPDLTELGGFALAEAGNYDLLHFSGAVSVPLVEEKLALRVSGDYFHRDGFDSDEGLGWRTNKNARIKLLAQPTEDLSILIGAALQDNEDATGGLSPKFDANGDLYFSDNPLGKGANQFRQIWAKVQWDLGFASLTYIPAYRQWTQDALNVGVGPGFLVYQSVLTPKDHFWTHEVRLSSSAASKLQWQLGILSYDNSLENSNVIRFGAPDGALAFSAETAKKTQAFGVFGEATYPITDTWRLTGGLRYDHTEIDVAQDYTDGMTMLTLSIPNGSDDGHREYDNWTYKLRTEFDVGARNLIYASVSTGFSPGDVTVTSDPSGQPFVLDLEDQTLTAFEIGSKNRFLGNALQANAAVFYYDYSGYQNAGIDIDERGGPFLAFSTLVSPVEIYGGELELLLEPTPNDRLGLDLAYTHARYVDSSAFFESIISNSEVADVPPFTAHFSYSHRFDLPGGSSLTFGGDARFLAAHDAGTITALAASFGGAPLIREGDLVIGNLNANWTSADGTFSISAYVRNVTDKRYSTMSEIELLAFPDDFNPVGIAGGNYRLTAPRTFGVVASVNF